MNRYDLTAQLGGIPISRYDSLMIRLEILAAELPILAAICAEYGFWSTLIGAGPRQACPWAQAYRRALCEFNDVAAELVSIGAFLAA